MFEPSPSCPLAADLRRRRRALGVSQTALSARIGTSAAYLSQHESGRPPSREFAERWAQAVADLELLAECAAHAFDDAADAGAGALPFEELAEAYAAEVAS
jgi:transcriptional regulator with XRE-family HTH domain